MDDDLWYFQIGGCLGIVPALAAFVGGWWYCAATYGFLLGFGLGWLPALILALLVELAVTLLWAPALAAAAYFVVLPALRENRAPAEASETIATSSSNDADGWQCIDCGGVSNAADPYAGFSKPVANDTARGPWEHYQSQPDIAPDTDRVVADAMNAANDAVNYAEAVSNSSDAANPFDQFDTPADRPRNPDTARASSARND